MLLPGWRLAFLADSGDATLREVELYWRKAQAAQEAQSREAPPSPLQNSAPFPGEGLGVGKQVLLVAVALLLSGLLFLLSVDPMGQLQTAEVEGLPGSLP